MKRKVWFISLIIMFGSTALLCWLMNKPLIFTTNDYSFAAFSRLAAFCAFLCFLFVYINLGFLDLLRGNSTIGGREEAFYVLGSLIILQIVTLFSGYLESSFSRHIAADPLYYYKGVTNSHIYIITANITTGIGASLYASGISKRNKTAVRNRLDT